MLCQHNGHEIPRQATLPTSITGVAATADTGVTETLGRGAANPGRDTGFCGVKNMPKGGLLEGSGSSSTSMIGVFSS